MTETELTEYLARVDALDNEEDGGETWMDADPEAAWGDPESRHGRLAALYLEAGWEGCYHREGAHFHYDVKMNGNGAYRGFRDKVDAAVSDNAAYDRISEIADGITEMELESWWENLPYDDISHIEGAVEFAPAGRPTFKVWQCGRSGGYLNAPKVENDPRIMLQLAFIAQGARDYFNSPEWGEYLAELAIEEYNERRMGELASPRIERIEA